MPLWLGRLDYRTGRQWQCGVEGKTKGEEITIQKIDTLWNIKKMKLQETDLNPFDKLECILYLQHRGLTQRAWVFFSPRTPSVEWNIWIFQLFITKSRHLIQIAVCLCPNMNDTWSVTVWVVPPSEAAVNSQEWYWKHPNH